MPNRIKGYFYHISDELSPKDHILTPRRDGCNRDPEEPDTPRICVCPTMAGCICAVGPSLSIRKRIRVFRTKNQVVSYAPFGKHESGGNKAVIDAHITKEKWLIRKTSFKFIGYINLMDFRYLLNFVAGDPKEFTRQQRAMKEFSKLEKRKRLLIH